MSFYLMHRGWMDHAFFDQTEPYTEREAWEWMIAEASWEKRTVNIGGNPVEITRGQLSHSLRFMAQKFQWTKGRIEHFLERLKKWDMIRTDSRTGQSIITICNYSKYQVRADSQQDTPDADYRTEAGQEQDKEERNIINTNNKINNSLPDDTQAAFDLYNETARRANLPEAQVLDDRRKASLKARLRESGGLDGWRIALEKLEASDFLTGRKTDFCASLDFVLQKKSFTKLMEGSYDNRAPPRKIEDKILRGAMRAMEKV